MLVQIFPQFFKETFFLGYEEILFERWSSRMLCQLEFRRNSRARRRESSSSGSREYRVPTCDVPELPSFPPLFPALPVHRFCRGFKARATVRELPVRFERIPRRPGSL